MSQWVWEARSGKSTQRWSLFYLPIRWFLYIFLSLSLFITNLSYRHMVGQVGKQGVIGVVLGASLS